MAKQKSLKTLFKESSGKTAHADLYLVNKTANKIIMNIEIGDTGQSSVSTVTIDGVLFSPPIAGSIRNLVIGNNKSLDGKFLEVLTIVTDVSKNTNKTSFDFSLKGGPDPFSFATEKTVPDNESAAYSMTIFFTT